MLSSGASAGKQVYAPILSGKLLTLRHEITSAATRLASKGEEDPGNRR